MQFQMIVMFLVDKLNQPEYLRCLIIVFMVYSNINLYSFIAIVTINPLKAPPIDVHENRLFSLSAANSLAFVPHFVLIHNHLT